MYMPAAIVASQETTILHALYKWASSKPTQLAYTFLIDGETDEENLAYGELFVRVQSMAAYLHRLGAGNERVLLLERPGLNYISSFLGCLMAGCIAVPVYPPSPSRVRDGDSRINMIALDAMPAFVIASGGGFEHLPNVLAATPEFKHLQWINSDDIPVANEGALPLPDCDSVAFLQYTSGSTSEPKGVMVTHRNLIHNERAIQLACHHTEESTFVGWLPFYHDMGLIGNILQPLFVGSRSVLMAPTAFLLKPIKWLQAISKYKGRTSGGPNFGYELCVQKINQSEAADLDLSSWTVAFNGSEPVRAETMDQFASKFAPQGFKLAAFHPCYGLAEATLMVAGGRQDGRPTVRRVRTDSLGNSRLDAPTTTENVIHRLVACGAAVLDEEIAIVDPDTHQTCADGSIGEIWIHGPNIAAGYWKKPEETEAVFRAQISPSRNRMYLRTGDLGFIEDGLLYVTGRLKDLIIVRGKNYYPQDIERTVEQCSTSLRSGCGAAFRITRDGEDAAVVVYEVNRHAPDDLTGVIAKIGLAVALEHGLRLYAIALVKSGSVPKTTSGKVRRGSCREVFLNGTLHVVASSKIDDHAIEPVTEGAAHFRELYLRTEPDLRETLVEGFITSRVSTITGIPASRLNLKSPLIEIGLDSLGLTQLLHSVEALGFTITSLSTLTETTIDQLTEIVHDHLSHDPLRIDNNERERKALSHLNDGTFTLSHGQRSLWHLAQLAPGSSAYNLSSAFYTGNDLSITAFRRSLELLIDRHASLRTTFTLVDGQPAQQMLHASQPCLDIVDQEFHDSALVEHLSELAIQPFDLENGPLFKVTIIRRRLGGYAVLFAMHHIIADFWSFGVFLREIGLLYAAEISPVRLALPSPPPYADYVISQARRIEEHGQRSSSYWKDALGDWTTASLDLPLDHPRPSSQTFRGSTEAFAVSEEITSRLHAFSLESKTTLFTTVVAAFQALLHRYTGQSVVLLGTPVAGRRDVRFADTIGYFVNPIVFRSNSSDRPSFRDFLSRTKRTMRESQEHQEFPFSLVVEQSNTVRDPSRSPVFQAMFVWEKMQYPELQDLALLPVHGPARPIEIGPLTLEPIELKEQSSQCDLTLRIAESDGCLFGAFNFNTDIFEHTSIVRLSRHFVTLLERVAKNPDQRISDVAYLSDEELAAILQWNDTSIEYSEAGLVPELIDAQAARTPDAIAVQFDDKVLTYEQLMVNSDQVAARLRFEGIRADQIVGVCVERCLEMVIALAGILKAGGAFLPLDPEYPAERLQLMVSDSEAAAVLTVADYAHLFSAGTKTISLMRLESEKCHASTIPLHSDNAVYAIYTSGSTGLPKGAVNTHAGLRNRLLWMQEYLRLLPKDVVLQKTPFGFDVSVWEFFWPLTVGAKLVLANPGGHRDANYLESLIVKQRVTILHFVPSMLRVFLDHAKIERCRSLRTVVCSGEALSSAVAAEFGRRSDAILYNLYGPTEAAIDVTAWRCGALDGRSNVPIGYPIANTQIHILDGCLQHVHSGATGELYIAGSGLGRGYVNHPALTAERFVPHPYSSEPGARMYRTGDLARHRQAGEIEFIGRLDSQVKIRGQRVELGEIEARLMAQAGVKSCVCSLRRSADGDDLLYAYIVVGNESAWSESQARAEIKKQLPQYMIPASFVVLDRLPLLPNGKIDVKALPESSLPEQHPSSLDQYRTKVETTVSEIWATVLQLPSVGMESDFFELGGHSLIATRILSRVRETYQVEIPLAAFFGGGTTVRGLAELIEQQLPDGTTEPQEASIPSVVPQMSTF